MIQTNKKYGTKRVVRRRPHFVSAADVQARRVRYQISFSLIKIILFKQAHITAKHCLLPEHRRPLTQASFAAVPDCWDKKQIPQTGYKVQST